MSELQPCPNPEMLVAIGDIHGMGMMLRDLIRRIEALGLPPETPWVFLGDYVDRGEDSAGVLNTLLELQTQRPDTIFLRGNHEQLMLDAGDASRRLVHTDPGMLVSASDAMQHWLQNGGSETLLSYQRRWTDEALEHWWDQIPEEHWEFLRATRLEYITERYHFVHAGVLPPGANWNADDFGLDYRLWIREPFLSSKADFDGRVVVFGHSPQRNHRPMVRTNKIGLDTGAVFHGKLTAAVLRPGPQRRRLPAPRIVQAPWQETPVPELPFDDE
ncbi:MAG: serine/threonine protein phosphatase [Armatimonadetes bacterium]|nr:serine/threonine protein phosphatase [Armatimonadota bacterium]MDE2206827.1 serine/threonine protein phosphatase [Armatimonadota bacterium]